MAPVVPACGFSRCSFQALEDRLRSCGLRAELLCRMGDLPRPGLDPSPALADGFFTTETPGKTKLLNCI